jgi:hypothetical protein
MKSAQLVMRSEAYATLIRHLLPPKTKAEEAAFVFATFGSEGTFCPVETYLVPPADFVHHSLYGIELADHCRAKVIKKAHDLGASLIEFHSHPYPYPAEFSPSDWSGFGEFVPHVWWRLKGRPYCAVVVAPTGFDSLVWLDNPKSPSGVAELIVGGERHLPTGLSYSIGEGHLDE